MQNNICSAQLFIIVVILKFFLPLNFLRFTFQIQQDGDLYFYLKEVNHIYQMPLLI